MVAVTTVPYGRPLSRADLEQVPDDGHRYELIDGSLVVTPAPTPNHQRVVRRLLILLDSACPAGLEVMPAPLDVSLDADTVLQPDLIVARHCDFTDRDLPVPPLLAVEVLSPSTRLIDVNLKRARYEAAGCPAYWVVDPDARTLSAWELRDGGYVEVAHVAGAQEYAAQSPYPVSITPAGLLD